MESLYATAIYRGRYDKEFGYDDEVALNKAIAKIQYNIPERLFSFSDEQTDSQESVMEV